MCPATPDAAFPASPVLGYEEAASLIRTHAGHALRRTAATEQAPLLASAGRILAQPVVADRDQPPFPRSTRDGYACLAADFPHSSPQVIGQLRAGQIWAAPALQSGQAVEIMTGAPVPPGADCVLMLEYVTVADSRISLAPDRSIASGENIVPDGAEALAGTVIVPAGRRLGPPEIAAAASCGYATLLVRTRPRVAILATGDELVSVSETPLPHQIRNSNSYSLAAQVLAAGGAPRIFPVVPDDPAATEDAIRQASASDLILLTGGVSMGKFDFVEQALLTLGARFFFTGARIQPGKPVVFGTLPETYFFGLPGNPISTMVTFALFAAPLLRALAGNSDPWPRFILARLAEPVQVRPGLTRFLPARLHSTVSGAHVARIPWQGSGDLAAAAQANCFLVVPETAERLAPDDLVSVLLL